MNKYVYVLRVDASGNQYDGYRMEMSEKIYDELLIDEEWSEEIAITDELSIISNKEGAVMGLPLNRALYDADGNLITIIGGNIFIQKRSQDGFCNISPDDIGFIEDRLRAILAVSHGFVFTRNRDELLEWENKTDCRII